MLRYDDKKIENYKKMLRNAGALSRLFSENVAPYLVSRSTENIYCEGLGAENLSRSDCTADAKYIDPEKGAIGIGIKTFLHNNGNTIQKVAEFNRQIDQYVNKTPKEMIKKVAELRNERIRFTKAIHGLNDMIYHCVTRKEGKILIFEESMDPIEISAIRNVVPKGNTISFTDGKHEYSFYKSKSTLCKRFNFQSKEPLLEIDVNILEQPYLVLDQIEQYASKISDSVENYSIEIPETIAPIEEFDSNSYVILPLFSDRGIRHVPEKSGLNQWNANGRKRDADEVYIPIPRWIHNSFEDFFPERDQIFKLMLPDSKQLTAKVCQEGRKALMSNPNRDLGRWLLRNVFNLRERELLTYEDLENAGIDSVRVTKINDDTYEIDFAAIGSYDEFKDSYEI